MKYKVKELYPNGHEHILVDEEGERFVVDLFVDAEMPEGETHESIVGKTVEIKRLVPYAYFTSGKITVIE